MSLSSARNPTLGKDPFAVGGFALGKEFAECKVIFTECNRHSAKPVNPVVRCNSAGIEGQGFCSCNQTTLYSHAGTDGAG